MRMRRPSRRAALAAGAAAAVAATFTLPPLLSASAATTPAAATTHAARTSSRLLASNKLILKSAKQVDLHNGTVRLPLHRGTAYGKTVWYVLTESSDVGLAADLDPQLRREAL